MDLGKAKPRPPQPFNNEHMRISVPNFKSTDFTVAFSNPGPGAFDTIQVSTHQPGIKISKSKRTEIFIRPKCPGVGEYEQPYGKAEQNRKVPTIRIGTSKRPPLASGTFLQNPGTGHYEPQHPKEAPSYTIGHAVRPPLANGSFLKNPGMGTYEPKLIPPKTAPAYKIGTAQRHDFTKERKGSPAPGRYEIILKPTTPHHVIGTSKRPPLAYPTCSPGPGAY